MAIYVTSANIVQLCQRSRSHGGSKSDHNFPLQHPFFECVGFIEIFAIELGLLICKVEL